MRLLGVSVPAAPNRVDRLPFGNTARRSSASKCEPSRPVLLCSLPMARPRRPTTSRPRCQQRRSKQIWIALRSPRSRRLYPLENDAWRRYSRNNSARARTEPHATVAPSKGIDSADTFSAIDIRRQPPWIIGFSARSFWSHCGHPIRKCVSPFLFTQHDRHALHTSQPLPLANSRQSNVV
jgi:hypothetical protein